jgi:hypothetical protein
VRRRSSVWSALLDPFLDTWEEQQVIDRQFEWFARLGLDRDAVTRWRREVAVALLAYNFGAYVWEWVRLDLHDALVADRLASIQEDRCERSPRGIERSVRTDQPAKE